MVCRRYFCKRVMGRIDGGSEVFLKVRSDV